MYKYAKRVSARTGGVAHFEDREYPCPLAIGLLGSGGRKICASRSKAAGVKAGREAFAGAPGQWTDTFLRRLSRYIALSALASRSCSDSCPVSSDTAKPRLKCRPSRHSGSEFRSSKIARFARVL